MASPADTLKQLSSAREIVLKDHTLYPQVVPGIIQVIAPAAQLELRRWGADFLAETFASQVVTADEKQQMCVVVLDTLRGYLTRKEVFGEEEDTSVVKSAVQCASSIYPYVFRHTVSNSSDNETWSKIAAIKSSILRRMDTAAPGVRICCIKFVACVVQTQTPGLIADPRKSENNEISLALVPRGHPIIPPANLEAEASGLLDRLLGVLQDNLTDPLIITATLNALSTLVHRRPSISSKILTTILHFNPLKLASRQMSGKDRIAIRSMTRTTMSFLLNCLKRNPNSSMALRIQQQVERLKHGLTEVFSEHFLLKRPAPEEPTDGLDDTKRQRLNAEVTNGVAPQQQPVNHPAHPPALPPGPVSLAQIWTLTANQNAANFDVTRLPPGSVAQLVLAMLPSVDEQKLTNAINVVSARWLSFGNQGAGTSIKPAVAEEEDDDYDPSMGFTGQSEQVAIRSDNVPADGSTEDITIGPFNLPAPPPLSEQERDEYSKTAVKRIFGTLEELDRESKIKGKQLHTDHGFSKSSTGGHDREGWVTLLTRLATRAPFNLTNLTIVKKEDESRAMTKKGQVFNVTWGIRESLLNYVMENFRGRIDVAITWLNEEWYSDRLLQKQRQDSGEDVEDEELPNYWHWTLRLLDSMMPYFDVKDGRILIRLLSEVPAINRTIFERVKKIAEDPERVPISTNTLLYLIMFRPPTRQMAIDCAEEMYKENRDARSAAKKILGRWRPGAVVEADAPAVKVEG
jgi:symplekin